MIISWQNILNKKSRSFIPLTGLFEGPYLPYTSSAMSLDSLTCVFNDICINNRKEILEFGAGVSTILLARLIKINKLETKLTSVESDPDFIEYLKKTLANEQTLSKVKIIHAPLTNRHSEYKFTKTEWYSPKVLEKNIKSISDLVIVDGPLAFNKDVALSRYPAVPYIFNRLAHNCSIYLDDANRNGEKQCMAEWSKNFDIVFNKLTSTTSVWQRGKRFNIIP